MIVDRQLWRFGTDAFAIAGLTAWAYVLAYLFEYGYFSFFQIPADFINIGPIQIVRAILGIFIFVSGTICVGIFFSPFLTKEKKPKIRLFTFFLFAFLLTVLLPYMAGGKDHGKYGFYFFAMIIIFTLIDLYHQRGESFDEKITAHFQPKPSTDPFDIFFSYIGQKTTFAFTLFFLICLLAYSLGRGQAERSQNFLVFNKAGLNYAVIRAGNDALLAMPVDLDSKTIKPKLGIFDPSQLMKDDIILNIQKINHIKIDPNE